MEAQSFGLMWPSHVCVVTETLLNINDHALQCTREGLLSLEFAATRLTAFHVGFGAIEARLKVLRVSNVGELGSTGKKGLSQERKE